MSARGQRAAVTLGDLLAALGAAIVLVTLWRPWYELRLPEELLDQARAFTSRMGELGPYAQQGIDQLRAQGSVSVTAWQAFEGTDVLLAGAAGVVIGLFVLTATGALAARLDGVVVLSGLVAAGAVGFRLIDPPGPGGPLGADLLHATPAPYAALAGALLMAGGGLVSLTQPAAPPVAAHDVKVWDAS